MRRLLIKASLAGSLIVFALSIDLFDAIFMFVFFGVVPLKAEPIPAVQMLLVYMAAGLFVLAYGFRANIKPLLSSLRRKQTQANVS